MKKFLRLLAALSLLALPAIAQPVQPNQYVNTFNLPVPQSGSTYLSNGDKVVATRGETYGLIAGFGSNCTGSQWVNAISAQGFGTCAQLAYADISGLGSAATANLGVSGATVPVLSGNLTWSGTNVFTGSIPSLSNGNLALGASTTGGGKLGGKGSTFDIVIQNGSGSSVCTVAAGATTLNCTGLQVAGANVLTSGGASGVTLGTATTANPQISGAPTSGFYTSGGTVSEEISGVQISNWASTGFSVNAGTYQIGGAQVLAGFGTLSTSLGLSALTSSSGMNYSTAIGASALRNGVSGGVYNTAVGAEALLGTTSGQRNTAVGRSAVSASSGTTSDQTGVGYQALFNATGGSNTALGSNAGNHITTGTQNVIIGPSVASSTLTIGTNNIIIGTNSAVDATTSSTSNYLNIGNALTGTLSGTTSSSLTLGGSLTVTALTVTSTCTGCSTASGTVNGSTAASVAYYVTSGTAVSGGGALTQSTTNVADSGTLSVTGKTTLTGGLVGTTTADNATAGNVGEYQSASVACSSPLSLTSNTTRAIVAMPLAAGDWQVCGLAAWMGGGTTTSTLFAAASATTSGADPGGTSTSVVSNFNAGTTPFTPSSTESFALPCDRVSLAATTTVYINENALFATSTAGGCGYLNARRLR